jgi:histone H3/H4
MTPHGRAAMREVEARRAGLTPGQERRRSGRQQRETPRDTLRALSRLLAPKTKPVVPTPPAPAAPTGRFAIPGSEDFDDGPDLERPRLSLPLGEEDEEDDSLLLPPRSAGLEDENFTVRSVELPRRAISELPPGRLSRGSFGSIRMSDQFGDLNESGLDGVGGVFDSSFAMGGPYRDDDVPDMDDGFEGYAPGLQAVVGRILTANRDNTATLRDIGLRRGRLSLASGRDSDIRPGMLPGDDTENTFVFTVPPRDVPDLQQSDDTVESPNQDDGENDWAEVNEDAERWNAMHEDVEMAIPEGTLEDANTVTDPAPRAVRKKRIKISKHGIPYPSLPPGVVKKLATTYARTSGNSKAKISKDTLEAIMQASDWFFEQVSDDLGAYAEHAGRKTIEERDVVTLMGR